MDAKDTVYYQQQKIDSQLLNDISSFITSPKYGSTFSDIWTAEEELMDVMRTGNVQATQEFFRSSSSISSFEHCEYSSGLLRNKVYEYLVVISIIIFARTAIAENVSTGTAIAIQDYYIERLAKLTSKTKETQALFALIEESLIVFTRMIRDTTKIKDSNYLVRNVKSYIQKNLYNKLSVQNIAKEFNMSPDYLSRLFKEETGVRLKYYIQMEKLKAASYLLIYSDYSLSNISYLLNFSSQSYFCEKFKLKYGKTPSEYRKTNKITISI